MIRKIAVGMVMTFMLFTGCNKNSIDSTVEPDSTSVDDGMVINNDLNDLSDRVVDVSSTDTIDFKKSTLKSTPTGDLVIEKVAQLLPPIYNGDTLQASHIRIVDNYAYVSYNTQGSKYLGGVDIIDISDPYNPVLISGVIFINTETNKGKDISSLDIETKGNNNFVWLTGAEEGNDDLKTPAIVEKYMLNSSNQFKHVAEARQFYDLNGYVGTDVKFSKEQGSPKIYVTSGTGGGLTILNNGMNLNEYYEVNNARSVDVSKDYVTALGGNPGTIFSPNLWNNEIGGATDPEAKSILKLYKDYLFTALGEDGLKCFKLTSGTPTEIASLPRPTVPVSCINKWEYVTNSVSIIDRIGYFKSATCHIDYVVFVANGAGGLDVDLFYDEELTKYGNIDLGASVNFVEANSNYIFAATGTGGLTIMRIVIN